MGNEGQPAAQGRADNNQLRLTIPEDLPIAARAQELVETIRRNATVIVAGATGSGKSTQLPKLCLLAGCASNGRLGMTQPRRIAARSIAARLATEVRCELGNEVGYKMRFAEATSEATRIKVMTDGTLLAELDSDPELRQYDAIIVDEAHERSLNIDFLLGYLHRLRAARPNLKIVITSATIDTERLAKHFDDAPIIEVEGRTFPVEIRYQPPIDNARSKRSLSNSIHQAIDTLGRVDSRGDVLVFLSGEREIHDVARDLARAGVPSEQILPLYSRLPRERQERIFKAGAGRRIILATNVAETSLTIPGIRFVIDAGTARISRYGHRSKIQRLLIEPISQASANQRAGRCGRTSNGVCIRLYEEADFDDRPEFTEPELLRSDLAGVVLRMLTLGLGDPNTFPFVDAPPKVLVRDGYRTLVELGALVDEKVTALGRRMARMPVDVRIARMLIEAETLRCVEATVTVAAVLSLQDPRERPADHAQAADEAQAEFRAKSSDFLSLLNLWRAYEQQRVELSRKKLQQWCQKRFLNAARMREWWELRRQLFRWLGHRSRAAADEAADDLLHRALLPALIANVGRLEEHREYRGIQGSRFQLFPGSTLNRKPPPWIMCAFVIETARVYGRLAAPIQPAWIESAAPHLLRHHYAEPQWSKRQGRVVAKRHASLFGLELPHPRWVGYAQIDRTVCRQLFLLEGLVNGRIRTRDNFVEFNGRQVARVEQMEAKLRSLRLLVSERARVAFFDARVPDQIIATRAFERWRAKAEKATPDVLHYQLSDLMAGESERLSVSHPDVLPLAGLKVPVHYVYDRSSQCDGATLEVPLAGLPSIDSAALEWLIPGWLPEKIDSLIRALPKPQRRALHPVGETAERLASELSGSGDFYAALADALKQIGGIDVSSETWREVRLAPHLRFNIRVLGRDGKIAAEGRDILAIRAQLGIENEQAYLTLAASDYRRDGETRWVFGDLSQPVQLPNGQPGWRAVVDQRTAVGVRVFEREGRASRWHAEGVRRLLLTVLKPKVRDIRRRPPVDLKTLLYYSPIDNREALVEDLLDASAGALVGDDVPRTQESFERLVAVARREILGTANTIGALLDEMMALHHDVAKRLQDQSHKFSEAVADQESQLGHMVYPGFLREISLGRLSQYPRYLAAALNRSQARPMDPSKDASRQREIEPHWRRYLERVETQGEDEALQEFRWLIEEWRVSLFAQALGTKVPVSARRVSQAWKSLTAAIS